MDERRRFMSLMKRLSTTGPRVSDAPVIQVIGAKIRKRDEEPVDRNVYTMAGVMGKIYKSVPVVKDPDDALRELGWRMIPSDGQPNIVAGNFGSIRLAYNRLESGVPLEQRHLSAAKIVPFQSRDEVMFAHNEISVLKSCIHENIIYLHGCFVVQPDHPEPDEPSRHVWLLMEYANAGDMLKEKYRYPSSCIPESGAKHYALQICAGVKYLHSKEIVHNDLHIRNILLSYRRDGTKRCMITDFGLAEVLEIPDPRDQDIMTLTRFQADVGGICWIISVMIGSSRVPKAAKEIVDIGVTAFGKGPACPRTVDDLLRMDWFKTRGHPPIPRSPTPMLASNAVREIQYMPQEHPTAAPVEISRSSSRPSLLHRARDNYRSFIRRFRRPSLGSGPGRQEGSRTLPTILEEPANARASDAGRSHRDRRH